MQQKRHLLGTDYDYFTKGFRSHTSQGGKAMKCPTLSLIGQYLLPSFAGLLRFKAWGAIGEGECKNIR